MQAPELLVQSLWAPKDSGHDLEPRLFSPSFLSDAEGIFISFARGIWNTPHAE